MKNEDVIFLELLQEFNDEAKKLILMMRSTYIQNIKHSDLPYKWRLDLLVPNVGWIENWRFSFHGYHCRFQNQKNGRTLDIPFSFPQQCIVFQTYSIKKYICSFENCKIKSSSIDSINRKFWRLKNKGFLKEIKNDLNMKGLTFHKNY